MPWLTDLADACRKSGLPVVEVYGWQTRGHGPLVRLSSITAHHTATPASAAGAAGSRDYPTLKVVRDGRAGLDGPLSQLGLGRNGTVYVIAAGKAYHAGAVAFGWQSNAEALGIEAEHPGGSTPWPPVQHAAYVRLVAALTRHYGVPVTRVLGHKEIAIPRGRKSDPTFDMDAFRRALSIPQEDDVTPDEVIGATRTALVGLFDEAATRSTPTGRALGDDLAAILAPVRTDPVKLAAALAPHLAAVTDQATLEAALRNVLGSVNDAPKEI